MNGKFAPGVTVVQIEKSEIRKIDWLVIYLTISVTLDVASERANELRRRCIFQDTIFPSRLGININKKVLKYYDNRLDFISNFFLRKQSPLCVLSLFWIQNLFQYHISQYIALKDNLKQHIYIYIKPSKALRFKKQAVRPFSPKIFSILSQLSFKVFITTKIFKRTCARTRQKARHGPPTTNYSRLRSLSMLPKYCATATSVRWGLIMTVDHSFLSSMQSKLGVIGEALGGSVLPKESSSH